MSNERVPVKLSVFAVGVLATSRHVIKDCLKFVACRTNFVGREPNGGGRGYNRCLSSLDAMIRFRETIRPRDCDRASVHVIFSFRTRKNTFLPSGRDA